MKYSLSFMLSLAALMLAGCSSTPTNVSKGSIKASTFSFVARSPGGGPAYADNREAIHQMIQSSITKNLASKGLTRQPTGGDVTVAYLVIVGNNVSTEAIGTYFGYGRDFSGLADKAQDRYSSNKNPNYFEAGTLLVDIIDSKSYKLIKRSYVVRPVLNNPTAEARADYIQEAVDSVLKDVRIAQ